MVIRICECEIRCGLYEAPCGGWVCECRLKEETSHYVISYHITNRQGPLSFPGHRKWLLIQAGDREAGRRFISVKSQTGVTTVRLFEGN
jgi:hypothetical protein